MEDILSEGREMESRRQLEQFYRNKLETEKQARPLTFGDVIGPKKITEISSLSVK